MPLSKVIREQFDLRNRRVFNLYKQGYSYRAIGELEDLSAERIRQIIRKMEKESRGEEEK